jgi:hypothetical protein
MLVLFDLERMSALTAWRVYDQAALPLFSEVFILKTLKSIVFIGFRKCSF